MPRGKSYKFSFYERATTKRYRECGFLAKLLCTKLHKNLLKWALCVIIMCPRYYVTVPEDHAQNNLIQIFTHCRTLFCSSVLLSLMSVINIPYSYGFILFCALNVLHHLRACTPTFDKIAINLFLICVRFRIH